MADGCKITENGSPYFRAIRQMLLIVVAAAALGVASNYLRSKPLPLVGNWSIEGRFATQSGGSMMISLADAKALFESHSAVFIDARPVEEFDRGHIQNARSLPWDGAEQQVINVIGNLPNDARIITYCDGATCNLSKDLAQLLKSLGFTRVQVLVNGWTIWHDAGLPVAVSSSPG